jgi:hypothetical protein
MSFAPSYCRFEETYKDLGVCTMHLWDKLNPDEHYFRLELIQLCREIAEEFPDEDTLQSLRYEGGEDEE